MRAVVFAATIALLAGPVLSAWGADNAAGRTIATSNNTFAFDLYARLASEKGNLFFSPFSIDTALAMTYAGARGNTAQQMANVLHFSMPKDKLNEAFAQTLKALSVEGKQDGEVLYQLILANALWGQQGYPFDESYQKLLQQDYRAALNTVDFEHAADQARQRINEWVDKQTNGKIKDLIAPGVLTPLTRLVLTNAIYFKSPWEDVFGKSATRNEPFHTALDQSTEVPMMNQQHLFGYLGDEQLQAVELPYRGQQLSMIVLLPRKIDGLSDLEKSLSADKLDRLLAGLKPTMVKLSLPKFKITSQFGLADVLKSMGMTDAFSPNTADFSGIATVQQLYIQAVIHKAFVDVNEEGTEAAAATGVIMGVRAALPPKEIVTFKADHPFLFLIRQNDTGAILFMGRLVNPK